MTYTIRATDFVAREMAKYEGNEIISQTLPESDDFRWPTRTTYLFTISGNPIVLRWNSFGVFFPPGTPIT